jgi:glycosyltransferase involved in cell wall biosynthesis
MQELRNANKYLFISEALSAPFDEGIKNVAFSLHKQLKIKRDALSVTNTGNKVDNLNILTIKFNKLFLNNKLRKILKNYSPNVILYLPEASITFNSFVRAKVLKLMCRLSKVVMLGIQHREYSSVRNFAVGNLLKPDLLLLLGKSDLDYFKKKGLKVKILPPAVDNAEFCKAADDEKERIRAEYNIPKNIKVVLHVGHIKVNRNIECLIGIQKVDNIQVVIVGSTSIIIESDLKNKLIKAGIRVIDEFLPDISRIYKMSDIYVFPVISSREAIDMPLSVLEAIACNLPVITTRFGALVDNFDEDAGFRYFDTPEELIKLVKLFKCMDRVKIYNDKKVEPFTWQRFANEVITVCDELV